MPFIFSEILDTNIYLAVRSVFVSSSYISCTENSSSCPSASVVIVSILLGKHGCYCLTEAVVAAMRLQFFGPSINLICVVTRYLRLT